MSLSNILKAICQRTEKEELLAVQRLMGKNAKKKKNERGTCRGLGGRKGCEAIREETTKTKKRTRRGREALLGFQRA